MIKLQEKVNRWTIIVSSIMLAALMVILTANVILRYVPGIGGFKWYMEGSQYLNVWAMLIAGIALSVKGEHLNVNIIEELINKKHSKGLKFIQSLLTCLFYLGFCYGAFLLAIKSKQEISTMAPLKMSYVYWMVPVTAMMSALSAILDFVVQMKKGKEEKQG